LDRPPDWAVELPFVRDESLQGHGYKPLGRKYPETSVGWYRRTFEIPESDRGRRIVLDFDGAFRDALVFLNGYFVGRNNNGYAPPASISATSRTTAARTIWSCAWMRPSAMAGSMKAQESIAISGSPKRTRSILDNEKVMCALT